ncbi:MAG: DUF192 domain-containing protein [Acidobacteriaceae bacterium]
MRVIRISNQTQHGSRSILAKYCQSFFCQLRGLMFTKHLADDQGLLLVQKEDSRINASIHMMFMWMDLAVIWINSDYTVVDQVLARRWKPAYLPQKPAKYVLETSVSHLAEFAIGDKVIFEET